MTKRDWPHNFILEVSSYCKHMMDKHSLQMNMSSFWKPRQFNLDWNASTEHILAMLPEREEDIIRRIYQKDEQTTDIANEYSLSPQAVNNRRKKAFSHIYRMVRAKAEAADKDGLGNEGSVSVAISIEKGDLPLRKLELSNRTYNALAMSGVFTVRDLSKYPNISRLKSIRNLGDKGAREIIDNLALFGITFPIKSQFGTDFAELASKGHTAKTRTNLLHQQKKAKAQEPLNIEQESDAPKIVFLGKGHCTMGQTTRDAEGNIIKHVPATFDFSADGPCIAVGEIDSESMEVVGTPAVYGDWQAAEYLQEALSMLNPQRSINTPDFKTIFAKARADGIDIYSDICNYCQNINCGDCIIQEWKEGE